MEDKIIRPFVLSILSMLQDDPQPSTDPDIGDYSARMGYNQTEMQNFCMEQINDSTTSD